MYSIQIDIPYPKLKQFQNAHRKLFQEYIGAIDIASRLPFFINVTHILMSHEKETTYESILRRLSFLSTPIVWKPFVRFLIEAHIKSKMKELIVAYQQLSLKLPTNGKFNRLREELKSAVIECNQLSDTLTTWKDGQTIWAAIVPVAIGFVTSWVSVDNFMTIFGSLSITSSNIFLTTVINYLEFFYWIWISVGLLIILFVFAFAGKRTIFLPGLVKQRDAVPFRNIYSSEDTLFELIGYKKTFEFAIDFVSLVFLVSSLVIGFLLPIIAVSIRLDWLDLIFDSFWGIVIFFILVIFSFTILRRDMMRRWS